MGQLGVNVVARMAIVIAKLDALGLPIRPRLLQSAIWVIGVAQCAERRLLARSEASYVTECTATWRKDLENISRVQRGSPVKLELDSVALIMSRAVRGVILQIESIEMADVVQALFELDEALGWDWPLWMSLVVNRGHPREILYSAGVYRLECISYRIGIVKGTASVVLWR